MSNFPTDFGNRAVAPALLPAAPAIADQWAALHQAATAIAQLAGLQVPPVSADFARFPASLAQLSGWRRSLVEQGTADLVAIMEPGLTALLGVQARGADPRVPAQALWQEFIAARAGLLAIVPGQDTGAA